MSKKFRRFYETAFDSKISKSDEDLLSAEKQDSAIAHRLSNQLQLSASANSVRQYDDEDAAAATASAVRASPSSRMQCKNRLFGFLLRKRRNGGGGGGGSGRQFNSVYKYRSSDSVVTSSSLSLESITSDSLSSHSSESPCYKRFPVPHVLSPISDKSSQDAGAEFLDYEHRRSSAAGSAAPVVVVAGKAAAVAAQVKTKPPQSLGLIKLNSGQMQHHGSDSGISVGSKPGDNYQELLDVPFDMPKLKRRQRFEEGPTTMSSTTSSSSSSSSDCTGRPVLQAPPRPQGLPFDMPKLRRRQTNAGCDPDGGVLPFDMPKLRKRQMDSCARVISLDFEIGSGEDAYGAHSGVRHPAADRSKSEQLKELPFDIPKLKNINLHEGEKKPDRSSLFLNVIPDNCAAANANNKQLSKTCQNKSQSNRPTLSLSNIKPLNFVEDIDISLPLDQQCWYHGPMNRLEAEKALHGQKEGTYLVRGNKGSYALSIKSAKGFIHMRITQSGERNYLGQSDRPFETIPDLIKHYTLNKLPAKGAEHVGLITPLAHQIQIL
ncbi:PREDICTED: SH2 domain-containing adapter protein E [Diuraphis noxia]|uniref:SH2 domain-containing adapter protein E n=1 Tax=Diuraphis noxia TaxID=143948 RepID=UPI0007637B64|nr:PREDICTED: SH2 domain-containing adapter protein E [Diuraphis noxia]